MDNNNLELIKSRILSVLEGKVIIKEGATNPDMYKILSGKVEVYTGYGTERENLVEQLEAGAFFGEIGVLAEREAIYTVIAVSDTVLLKIRKKDLGEFIQGNPNAVFQIMKNMANTMADMKGQINLLNKNLDELNKKDEEVVILKDDKYKRQLVYNPRNPHMDMSGKMRFLGKDKDKKNR